MAVEYDVWLNRLNRECGIRSSIILTGNTADIIRSKYSNNANITNYQTVMEAVIACVQNKGYTQIVKKMLEGAEVRLETDYFSNRDAFDAMAEKCVFTGMIDAYYDYRFGPLAYRSVRFETEELPIENYQGNAVVNYTAREVPYTRIIEHKHFEFGKQPTTIISREYSAEWKPGIEPYYPINDAENGTLYQKYAELAAQEKNVIFGGRLGQYKYYDMDKVIAAALEIVCSEIN